MASRTSFFPANLQAVLALVGVTLLGCALAKRWHDASQPRPRVPDPRASFRFERRAPRADEEPAARPPFSLQLNQTERELPLVAIAAKTVVEGPFAETTLRLSFDNPERAAPPYQTSSSGSLRLVLRRGAHVVRVRHLMRALREKDKLVDEAVSRTKTPLGEDAEAHVPVLDGRGTEEIEVKIAHILGATTPLFWPVAGAGRLRALDIEVRGSGEGAPLLAERHLRDAEAQTDFVYAPADSAEGTGLRAGERIAVRIPLRAVPVEDRPQRLIVLVDTSGSGLAELDARAQELEDLLRALGPVPTTVAAFDQEVDVVARGPAATIASTILAKLDARQFLGGSDLSGALAWAADDAALHGGDRILLVTDGVATLGETGGDALRAAVGRLGAAAVRRLDVVAVGARRADAFLATLVSGLLPRDGLLFLPGSSTPARIAALTHSAHCVRPTVRGAAWAWPTEPFCVPSETGGEALLFAALPARLPVRVDVVDVFGRKQTLAPVLSSVDAAQIDTPFERARSEASGSDTPPLALGLTDPRPHWNVPRAATGSTRRFPTDQVRPPPPLPPYRRKEGEERRREPVPRVSVDIAEGSGTSMSRLVPALEAAAQSCFRATLVSDWDARGRVGFAIRFDEDLGGRIVLENDDDVSPVLVGCLDAALRAMPAPNAGSPHAVSVRGVLTFAPTTVSDDSLPPRAAPPSPPAPARLSAPPRSDAQRVYFPFGSPAARALARLDVASRAQLEGSVLGHSRSMAFAGHDETDLIFLADRLLSRGEVRTAERVIGTLLDLAPDQPDIRRLAGAQLEALETPSASRLAMQAYRGAIDVQPDEPLGYHLLAWAMVRAGEPAAALDVVAEGLAVAAVQPDPGVRTSLLRDDAGLIGAACQRAGVLSRAWIEARLASLGASLPTRPSARVIVSWEGRGVRLPLVLRDEGGDVIGEIAGRLAADEHTSAPHADDMGLAVFPLDRAPARFVLQTIDAQVGERGYLSAKIALIGHDGAGGLSFVEAPIVWAEYVDFGGHRMRRQSPYDLLFRHPRGN